MKGSRARRGGTVWRCHVRGLVVSVTIQARARASFLRRGTEVGLIVHPAPRWPSTRRRCTSPGGQLTTRTRARLTDWRWTVCDGGLAQPVTRVWWCWWRCTVPGVVLATAVHALFDARRRFSIYNSATRRPGRSSTHRSTRSTAARSTSTAGPRHRQPRSATASRRAAIFCRWSSTAVRPSTVGCRLTSPTFSTKPSSSSTPPATSAAALCRILAGLWGWPCPTAGRRSSDYSPTLSTDVSRRPRSPTRTTLSSSPTLSPTRPRWLAGCSVTSPAEVDVRRRRCRSICSSATSATPQSPFGPRRRSVVPVRSPTPPSSRALDQRRRPVHRRTRPRGHSCSTSRNQQRRAPLGRRAVLINRDLATWRWLKTNSPAAWRTLLSWLLLLLLWLWFSCSSSFAAAKRAV